MFGVKKSLLVDLNQIDGDTAQRYAVSAQSKVLRRDFVLVTEQESAKLRDEKTQEAFGAAGFEYKLWNGMPIPDVD